MNHTIRVACAALAGACCLLATPALAAESFGNCTGFIDALPATVGTPGIWCLRKDLATAMSSGTAITVAGDRITIECNGFRVGGLAAGVATRAHGIEGLQRHSVTVRGCNVRGFQTGIQLSGDNHLIENNRLDANTVVGIAAMPLDGGLVVVKGNRVRDTGGGPGAAEATGILAGPAARVVDNDIHGVSPSGASGDAPAHGVVGSVDTVVTGNRISSLIPAGSATASGIFTPGPALVTGNTLTAVAGANARAIDSPGICEKNMARRFAISSAGCGSPSNTHLP